MLHIKRFIFNPICVNTYVLWNSHEGSIIDCGCIDTYEWEELNDFITSQNITITHLLNTHLHLDHVLGNRFATESFGLDVEANKLDYPLYSDLRTQVCMFFGDNAASSLDYTFTSKIGKSLEEGSYIQIGDEKVEIISTPGHTPGSICFYNRENGILFSGDTLFQSSIGRTDLPGGNYEEIINSLSKLSSLPPSTTVYSGHGGKTTIESELKYNPFLR